MRKYICTLCGYEGKRLIVTPGSLVIEIILWCCWLIPGIIYSIWRTSSRYYVCPDCQHETMIPKHRKQ